MSGFAGKEESFIIQMKNDDSFSNNPSKEVDLNICIESQKEVLSNAKNDTAENSKNEIMNAKERMLVESDTEEDAINTNQKQKS